ncbi:mitochondrial 2-oxodicarboxylate carrier [Drosophila innubila]|uniref:mitochondrial 2-oxodicarboxylate carrier n=1 Tax=Drosophila innubila TaxID=198719 RepID=UPI00148DBA1B|nr:mitochondrial 2-oxodicarboxylate carrier [Drosophila innubila]
MPISDNVPDSSISRVKWVQIQLLSGGASSIAEVSLLLPLDVVKTRLQLQTNAVVKGQSHYRGVFDAFAKIYRQEGITAFWRGIIPPLLIDTPRRAVKFMVFEQLKPVFFFGASKPTLITYALAGGCAGITEAIMQNPFEVIKVTQQANRKQKLSTIHVARTIFQSDGFGSRGFYKGVGATVARNFIFHVMYFGFFCTMRDVTPICKDRTNEFLRKCGLALLSGWLGCIASIPFDVAKSRMQGPQPVQGQIKYSGALQTVSTIYREEGLRALYKGLTPQLMRGGPGGAILLLGYEYMTYLILRNLA